MVFRFYIFLSIFFVFTATHSVAQNVSVNLGNNEIGENQFFTITITLTNGRINNYDGFPEIKGFTMSGSSTSSQTEIINGQRSSRYSITMNYAPQEQGEFTLKPFTITVNGMEVKSPGTTIKVGPPIQRQADPFRNLFDHDPSDYFNRQQSPEFIEVDDEAFLAISTNKKEVYIGEGFTMNISFYVSEKNRAVLQFHELGKQLSGMLKDVRPDNCWEENFNIENINGEEIIINNNRYTQYKLYEATYFPFNPDTITFPSIGLEMIKYKVAKKQSFFGRSRQEDFKTFYTKSRTVKVKPLPPHPLKDIVPVGVFKLDEAISSNQLETGQSFKYDFNVYGEGNFASMEKPQLKQDGKFDFYDPTIRQKINKRNQKVTGNKLFSYFAIPNEPGSYNLEDYFSFIFFNPKAEKYDTLKSAYRVTVKGESMKNESIMASDLGSFYNSIDSESNELVNNSSLSWMKIIANVVILLSVIFVGILVYKK